MDNTLICHNIVKNNRKRGEYSEKIKSGNDYFSGFSYGGSGRL